MLIMPLTRMTAPLRKYTRPTQVFSFCSASLVPQGKASRRVIASPVARSDNAAIGCERRAPRLKTRVWRV